MPAVAREGVDICGGVIQPSGSTGFKVSGSPVAVVGDAIAPHGLSPHSAATLISGSGTFTFGGKKVCRVGDSASCGHTISTGSSTFFVGS
jgi:uncharacterized Zn-binding protein involved in type VI secretion